MSPRIELLESVGRAPLIEKCLNMDSLVERYLREGEEATGGGERRGEAGPW